MAIDKPLQAVEELLLSVTESSVPLLTQTSAHILSAGGKRLRPRLVLLAYEACGGQTPDDVVPLAAAVEIVHTATLVHDDINDHGTLRRGRETVNSRWGGTFALLTGDYLFTKTYEIMAPFGRDVNAILARAAIELVEGETLQIHAAKNGTLDRDVYMEIIAKKTASLFVAAVMMGATAAGAPEEWIRALSDYGYNLGLAFQITDDVLDLVADPQQMGKNTGIDLAQGRGIAAASNDGNHDSEKPAVATAVQVAQDTAPAPFAESLFGDNHTIELAVRKGRGKARELAERAAASLNVLPGSPALEALYDLTRQVIERDH